MSLGSSLAGGGRLSALRKAPIRVLHLRDSPWVDGPGRTILDTASHLDHNRVEYHVGALVSGVSKRHPLVEALGLRGASVYELDDRGGLDYALVELVVRLIDDLGIDVLHSSEPRSNLIALLCRRKRKVKLVSTAHGWIVNSYKARVLRTIDKIMLGMFDRVIFVSQATRRRVPEWWLPDSRTSVLHNGLVLDSYGEGFLRRKLLQFDRSSRVVLLNVGRLSREKGQDLLLRAIARISRDWPDLQLKFAGIGPEERKLRELAHALGIGEKVSFLSFVEDMPRLYSEADLLIQSSLTEGLPNVILEAAYLGVPIVATDVGGTGEIIQDGHSGRLVRAGSVDGLVQAVSSVLADAETTRRMVERAHERIVTHFSFAARTERLMALYEEISGEGRL